MKSRFRTNGSFFELLDEMKKMEPGRLKELIVRYFQYKEGDLFVNDSVDHPEEINFSMEFNKLFDFKSGPNFFFPSSILKINAENLHSENNRSIE